MSIKQPGGEAPAVSGRITFLNGRGELPMVEVKTHWSTAEVYMHGAHVTHFQKHNEPPLLFLSQLSHFQDGEPIRGGVPVIFPWFGPRTGMLTHGFVRNHAWELENSETADDGSVILRLCLPEIPETSTHSPFTAEYIVTVSDELTLEFVVVNRSRTENLEFENCLHTYFAVQDITEVSVTGLKGVTYVDKVDRFLEKVETGERIQIASEMDRVYTNTTAATEIHDPGFQRRIRVDKENSASTVVWNPWIAKARQLPDFGDDEYRGMVCVESGNVGSNRIILPPGQKSALKVRLSSDGL